MDIFYPYNESLPKRTAHDVYIFRNCASLCDTGLPVKLVTGWAGWDDKALFQHYQIDSDCPLTIQRLPLLRKWGPISCNVLFFWAAQRAAQRQMPRWLITSVFKQAAYHISRRIVGVQYAFEVHQLGWYPTYDTTKSRQVASREREILNQMQLVTTTTDALRKILRQPPYSLTVPIEVIPLAVDGIPLLAPPKNHPFTVMYIGQLYPSQGVDLLLQALALVPNIRLEVIGGKVTEVDGLRHLAERLRISDRVHFHGFLAPSALAEQAQRAQAFVAPFYATERMPYVAHTKLLEYISWNRPVIAPSVDVVLEYANAEARELLFQAGDKHSLADKLRLVMTRSYPSMNSVMTWKGRATLYRQILEQLVQ